MKRIAVIAAAIAMFASTAAVALADDATETTEGEMETSEERILNETQMWKVNILADYWLSGHEDGDNPEEGDPAETSDGEPAEEEVSIDDEIEALRTGKVVVGWGAVFKLMQLARAHNMSLTEVVDLVKDADEGWAFGRRFKELELNADGEELEGDHDSPKNFGQLKKQYREENGTRDKKPKRP